MIKAVLFDIDNTLLDFDAFVRQCLRKGFDRFSLGEYTDRVYEIFAQTNREMWGAIEAGRMTYKDLMQNRFNCIFAQCGIDFDGPTFEAFFCEDLFNNTITMDGAVEILEYLRGRYVLCVASNGPYAQQVNRLRLSGLLPCFSHLFISEQIGYAKPDRAFFLHCLNELALAPDEVLMVGDSYTSDICAAKACGLKTCYLGKGDADWCVRSLWEIREIL